MLEKEGIVQSKSLTATLSKELGKKEQTRLVDYCKSSRGPFLWVELFTNRALLVHRQTSNDFEFAAPLNKCHLIENQLFSSPFSVCPYCRDAKLSDAESQEFKEGASFNWLSTCIFNDKT